ncbi:hypothetical protein BDD12DRAFT_880065 [Trichophaea hybrida]|nr:hypothetical protein BDD12DRAFT_880065 [Trichophaea hybrida]
MPQIPDPPKNCLEIKDYKSGDTVYYYRLNKWREGSVVNKGGSSDDSPRYVIKDAKNSDHYTAAECDMRKKT